MFMNSLTEQQLQVQCVNWFMLQYPDLFIFAVPNGGSRHKLEAVNLKREGVKKGVSDLVIMLPGGRICFIEMKRPAYQKLNTRTGKWNKVPSGKQSPDQKKFQETCETLEHDYCVVKSFEEFQKKIQTLVDN